MKAVRIYRQGGPEVLQYEDVPDPEPGPDEVLIRLRAAALNHLDIWTRRGRPGQNIKFPLIIGSDGAGEVVQTGSRVRGVAVHEAVLVSPGLSCGHCEYCLSGRDNLCRSYNVLGTARDGTYAEYVVLPWQNVVPMPANLDFVSGASIPLVFTTAWHMLVGLAQVQPGQEVLVWGASSGVGSAAIQIAKLHGAVVYTTASSEAKAEKARALGADVVIDYTKEDVLARVRELTGGRGVDIVFDHVGEATWNTSIRALTRGGRLVSCGSTTGTGGSIDIRYLFSNQIQILGSYMGSKAELLRVLELVSAGKLRPVVHDVYPLAEASRAHATMEAGNFFGKLTLAI